MQMAVDLLSFGDLFFAILKHPHPTPLHLFLPGSDFILASEFTTRFLGEGSGCWEWNG